MRPVRPTLKALLRLPRDSFDDATAYDAVLKLRSSNSEAKAQIISSLRLNKVSHPLLSDAQGYFAKGVLPDKHQGSTQKRGAPVYEVRSFVGAGWRGGVILDDGGDPWLVYVDKHDQFHASAPTFFASDDRHYLPTLIDRKVRENEEADEAHQASDVACLMVLIETLAAAVERSPEPRTVTVTGPSGSTAELSVAIDLGIPAGSPAAAHESTSDVNLEIEIDASDHELRDQLIRLYVPFIQPDDRMREQAYRKGYGTIQLNLIVSHAHLAQLLVTGESGESPLPAKVPAATARHYVPRVGLAGAYVRGEPVLALCHTWFVPTRDGEAATDLPICESCEQSQPVAQKLLDMARKLLDQS